MDRWLLRSPRRSGSRASFVVIVAAVLIATGALGYLLWALMTRNADRLAWQVSMATIWAAVVPCWGVSVTMLGWVVRRARTAKPLDAEQEVAPAASSASALVSTDLWPIIVGKQPARATAFQERPRVNSLLKKALTATGSTTVVTQVLAGDGGIGKTQLAVEAYEQAHASGAYAFCLWVTARSEEAIITSYWTAMRTIKPSASVKSEEAANEFLEWLGQTRHPWFIVLDDVADPAHVEGWWPVGPSGRTLVTTRRQDASLGENGRKIIVLGVFKRAEAKAYLTERLSDPLARPDALKGWKELVRTLGFLPLALSQAAAVIIDDGIRCEEYSRRFADQRRTLADLFPDPADKSQRTVSATWSLALESADRLRPRGLSRPLLALIAVLDSNGIPESVLTTDAAQAFVDLQLAGAKSGPLAGEGLILHDAGRIELQRAALRALHKLSLIVHHPEDVTRSVRMHTLAQRATREAIDDQTQRRAFAAAADALIQAWPANESDGALSGVLRENTVALADLADQADLAEVLWMPQVHKVLFRAGRSMEEVGLINAALDYWQQMLSESVRWLGPKNSDTLTIRREVANCQGQAGNAVGAVNALEDLLADLIQAESPKQKEILRIRRDLAWWHGEMRDPVGAVAAYEELLHDMLNTYGRWDYETVTVRYDLARWRGQAGDPQAAVDDLMALYPDCIRVAKFDDPLRLAVSHDLAWWLGESWNADAAVEEFESLLPHRRRILGDEHPFTLATQHDLAWWRWDRGERDRAGYELNEVYKVYRRVMGPAHPQTVAVREDIDFLIAEGQDGVPHGKIRDTPQRVPGDLPGLDFLRPTDQLPRAVPVSKID